MLKNEPFRKLPAAYIPRPKFDHHPPILRFGFAIPNHVNEFRRVALKYRLGDPEKLNTARSGDLLRELVTTHLNERCGIQPKEGVVCEGIHSKESDLVLEIATNYRMQIPGDKIDEMLASIREVFSLPDDVTPKWYLEFFVLEKDADAFRLPSESHISKMK